MKIDCVCVDNTMAQKGCGFSFLKNWYIIYLYSIFVEKEQNIRNSKCIFSYKVKVVGCRDDILLSNPIKLYRKYIFKINIFMEMYLL